MVAMNWEVELAREADDWDVQLLDVLVIGVPVDPHEDSVSRVLWLSKQILIIWYDMSMNIIFYRQKVMLILYIYSAFHAKGIPKG